MLYGYARGSTLDHDLSIQLDALSAAGCTVVRSEKVTGTSTDGREEQATLPQFLRDGDTLVVTRIDRLARSLRDLQNTVHDLRQRGVTLKATEQPIDTSTAAGKCFLDMLGVFAEFETNLRKERQMERHRQGEGKRHLCGQRSPGLRRRGQGARDESAGPWAYSHR
jgi:DNA invertase Pin-like site-specific DNA recombinase